MRGINLWRTLFFLSAAAAVGCTTTGGHYAATTPPVPAAPKVVSPYSNAPAGETVYLAQPVLEWQPAAYADGYAAYVSEFNGTDYDLVYNSETDSGGLINTTTLALPPGVVHDDGQYRWNVRAWNRAAGWGPFSDRAEFQIQLYTDAELQQQVHEHLERAPRVDASRIDATVANGQVVLVGCVPSPEEIDYAYEVVESVGGVQGVYDQRLHVC